MGIFGATDAANFNCYRWWHRNKKRMNLNLHRYLKYPYGTLWYHLCKIERKPWTDIFHMVSELFFFLPTFFFLLVSFFSFLYSSPFSFPSYFPFFLKLTFSFLYDWWLNDMLRNLFSRQDTDWQTFFANHSKLSLNSSGIITPIKCSTCCSSKTIKQENCIHLWSYFRIALLHSLYWNPGLHET